MPLNLNVDPYYDDFDAQKNFLRVMFRPGYAVQARELTQAQSILQNQISSFGDNIFKNNTPILNGEIELNFTKNYIKINPTDKNGVTVTIKDWLGAEITGGLSGAVAEVTHIDEIGLVLYIEYRGGKFDDIQGEEISFIDSSNPAIGDITKFSNIVVGSSSNALMASVKPGIFYTDGTFVIVKEQTVFIDSLSALGNYNVGFNIEDTFITEENDQSLSDPAKGSFNYNAPGAARLNKELILSGWKNDSGIIAPKNFFMQLTIENGKLISTHNKVEYADLMDTMAQRTFDESGNYSIEEFPILAADNPTTPNSVDLTMEEGKAYVQGYEIEKISPTTIHLSKARTAEHIRKSNQVSQYPSYGPYIDIQKTTAGQNDISGLFDVSAKEEVELCTVAGGIRGVLGSVTAGQYPNIMYDASGNPIRFRIAAVVKNNLGEMRIFLTDAEGRTDLMSSAQSLRSVTTGNWANFEKYANGLPVAGGSGAGIAVFKVNLESAEIKDFIPNQTTFQSVRTYKNVTVTTQTASISADDNFMNFVPSGSNGLVEIVDNLGNVVVGATYVTSSLPGQPSTATVNNIGLDANSVQITNVDIICLIDHNSGSGNALTKTVSTISETLPAGRANNKLAGEDIISLSTVFKDPAGANTDVTTLAVLDNGARDFYYDRGSVGGLDLAVEHLVTYTQYNHTGTGKYFVANSYPNYDNIPDYKSQDGISDYTLRNCIDFRRKVSSFTAVPPAGYVDGVDIVVPDSAPMTYEYNYYVSRIDKLFIDAAGNFGVKAGIPAIFPEEPDAVDESMTIAVIKVPAYTFKADDVEISPIEHRRHTMKDISELEERIRNLEYYTSLNSLEQEASKRNILDANGNNMFKNGILTDSFNSFESADELNPDFRATVDKEKGQLRGTFNIDNVDMFPSIDPATSTLLGVSVHQNSATLNYTTKQLINQPKSSTSINVNPYAVFTWQGQVSLRPSSDHWVSTVYFPLLRKTIGRPVRRQTFTSWGSWRTSWRGARSWARGNWWRTTTSTTNYYQSQRRIYQATIVPTTRQTLSDRVVSNSNIPFMRSRWIRWEATGMRPGIPLNASFNGVDVSNWTYGRTTDVQGNAKGWFYLPPGKFTAGRKEFKLVDAIDGEDASSAAAFYTSSGILRRRQRTLTTIHGSYVARNSWLQTSNWSRTTSRTTTRRRRRWYDPIAQSFLISTEAKKGVFLDSIDVYFKTKDANLPVTVHLVEMDNGFPTQSIVPFSEVTMSPANVNLSVAAPNNSTRFSFSDPVYLQESAEYAFVVLSNSTKYELLIGTIGQANLLDSKGIYKQPYAGVMFKSQNASTWDTDQNSDVAFTLNSCVFDTSTPKTYKLDSNIVDIKYRPTLPYVDNAFFDGGETVTTDGGAKGVVVAGSLPAIEINSQLGLFNEGETITGGTSGATALFTNLNSTGTILYIGGREVPGANSTVFTIGETITGGTSGATAIVTESDHWRVKVSSRNAVAIVDGEAISGNFGNTSFVIGTEIPSSKTYHATHTNMLVDVLELNGTNVDLAYKFADEVSTSTFESSEDVSLSARKIIDANNIFTMDVTLSTTHADVSPVISLNRVGVTVVDADDWKKLSFDFTGGNAVTGTFLLGEAVTAPSGAQGVIKEILTDSTGATIGIVVGDHNRISFLNLELVTGTLSTATAKALLIGTPGKEWLNQGTYISVPVTLTEPANDLRVIIHASIPKGGSVVGSFKSIVNSPRYVDLSGAAPLWSVNSNPVFGLEQKVIGKEIYVYSFIKATPTTIPTLTAHGRAVVTKTTATQIFLKSISHIGDYNGSVLTNNYIYSAEDLGAAVMSSLDLQTWAIASSYLIGDYVISDDLLWRATRASVGITPDVIGSDWVLVPAVLATNLIHTSTDEVWRTMKYEVAPSGNTEEMTEYTLVPDEFVGEDFSKFVIKLELEGNDPAKGAIIENFRAIAVS